MWEKVNYLVVSEHYSSKPVNKVNLTLVYQGIPPAENIDIEIGEMKE